MKRKLLLIPVLGIGLFSAQAQNNPGFENWDTEIISQTATSWITSGSPSFGGLPNASQTTDAANGSYAIKIETIVVNTDTLMGFAAIGNVSNGLDATHPYTSAVDEVRFNAKWNMMTGDTAAIVMTLRNATDTLPIGGLFAIGSQASFTPVSFDITPFLPSGFVPTHIAVGFTSANVFSNSNGIPGSWIIIDDVQLFNGGTAQTALPNPGFENWDAETVDNPEFWNTQNNLAQNLGSALVEKTIDASSGNYAAQVSTIDIGGGNVFPGFLTNGDFVNNFPLDTVNYNINGGAPYAFSPTSMTFDYKYSPSGADTAFIIVQFKNSGTVVGSGLDQIFGTNTSYTSRTTPITVASTPDEMAILFYAGNNGGSSLKVDNVLLVGGNANVGINPLSIMHNIEVYPNPTSDVIHISLSENTKTTAIDLYDVQGNVVIHQENIANQGIIDVKVNHLSAGSYILLLQQEGKNFSKEVIIK